LGGFVHFNLKTFIWSRTPSVLDVESESRILFDCEGIAGKMRGLQRKTVGERPLPALQTLAWEPIHQIETDICESGGSGLSHRCDGLTNGTGPSYPSKVAILHRFRAETHASNAGLKQLNEILLGDRRGVRFNGDFTVGGKGEMCANSGQDCDKLSRGEYRRCAAPNIDRLDGPACGYVLLRRQSDLLNEGLDKGLGAAFAMDLKIEGAEVTSLSTEGDVEV